MTGSMQCFGEGRCGRMTIRSYIVVGLVSRTYVEPVHCRRPRFLDCCCTSLELCRSPDIRSFSSLPLNCQASAQDRTFLTEFKSEGRGIQKLGRGQQTSVGGNCTHCQGHNRRPAELLVLSQTELVVELQCNLILDGLETIVLVSPNPNSMGCVHPVPRDLRPWLILSSVRRRGKNVDSSSKSNPLRRRGKNYDTST